MKRTLIVYYSRTGNNRYIAGKLSQAIQADAVEMTPSIRNFFLLLMSTWLKIGVGVAVPQVDIGAYDRVVLLGPIWIGRIAAPVRTFVKRYGNVAREWAFVAVCGGSDVDKDGAFGYERVFREMESIIGGVKSSFFALSTHGITVVSSNNVPLVTDKSFTGDVKKRFDDIARSLRD